MNRETILVVDDNHQIADFISGTILPSLGYTSTVAYSGRQAIQILRSQPISLMVVDLQLPDTTGLDLLRKLANEGNRVPAILMTAHGSEQVAVDAFRLGVIDYLIKPVDPDMLADAVTRALTESRLRKDNESLMNQLKSQISWLTTLSKVGQSVTSSLDTNEVLSRIVEAGVHLTHAEEGFLALIDEKTSQIYLRAVKNIDQDKSKTMRLPVVDSLVGKVITTAKPLRISQSSNTSPLKVTTGFLVRSLIYVPLSSKGKALGVLAVDNQLNRQPFTEQDEAMLTSMADYATVALENANLYQKAQQEINERKRVEAALRESEERYALAVRSANDGLWDWDLKTNRVYYSPRWKSILGYKEDEVQNSPEEWFARIHPDDVERTKLEIAAHCRGTTSHFQNEHRIKRRDGTYRWVLSRGIAVWNPDGVPLRIVGSLSDIHDRKQAEYKLLHDAFYDTLTELPNRTLFMDRLKQSVERTKRRSDYLFAVLFLDLDRFKDINDSLGHLLGDQLLINVGKKLTECVRDVDTVARQGGDEFVILLDEIVDISDVTLVADRVMDKLAAPFSLNNRDVFVSTSIGIVLSITGYNTAEEVLRDADIAMYRAKAQGRARYEIFDPEMRERIMERLSLENDLRLAFERKELLIHYQPIISLKDNSIIGFEALTRWQHPKRGLIGPDDFVPLAEETGLIVPMGAWVLYEACRQMREWQELYPINPALTININLSGRQMAQANLLEEVHETLKETGMDARNLRLEITESAIMDNLDLAVEIFRELRDIGVQIQIDDFGMGYSSMNYLSRFPVSTLKIGQVFVSRMSTDDSYLKIIQAIVMLAHGLGMDVIAEGVETEQQLITVKKLGCEYAQGYYLAKPWDKKTTSLLIEETLNGINQFSNRLEVDIAKND